MPDVVVFGHGFRLGGTSTGTYVVPEGVTIHFFGKDGQMVHSDGAEIILRSLCTRWPDPRVAAAATVEAVRTTRGKYATIPNYVATGGDDLEAIGFPFATGAYWVGETQAFHRIRAGVNTRLSDIIGGAGRGGVIANRVYWVCCRAKLPHASNNPRMAPDEGILGADDGVHALNANVIGSDSGLRPSQVVAQGRRWR
jgi:hypothetical protein